MIEILDDKDALAAWAASWVAQRIEASTARFVIALSGGSTPKLFHRILAQDFASLPWDRVDAFVSDERAVPPDDERSNVRMARETLIEPLGANAPTLFVPTGIAEDARRAAHDYEAALLEATSGTGVADVVMLGMGDDGHVASLFPGFEAPFGLVAAVDAPAETVATRRVTFTFEALKRARDVVVLVAGASKAAALHRVIDERDASLPLARVFMDRGGRVTLVTERAAAAQLDPVGVHE